LAPCRNDVRANTISRLVIRSPAGLGTTGVKGKKGEL
jgi:hypothetical protein